MKICFDYIKIINKFVQKAEFFKKFQNRLDFFWKAAKIELALKEREC